MGYICVLRAHVNQSQNSQDNAREEWVITKEDGTIITPTAPVWLVKYNLVTVSMLVL